MKLLNLIKSKARNIGRKFLIDNPGYGFGPIYIQKVRCLGIIPGLKQQIYREVDWIFNKENAIPLESTYLFLERPYFSLRQDLKKIKKDRKEFLREKGVKA